MRTVLVAVALGLAGCSFPDVGFTGAGGSGGAGQGATTTTDSAGGGGASGTTTSTGGQGGSGGAGGSGVTAGIGGGLTCIDGDGDKYLDVASDAGCLGNGPFFAKIDCDDDDVTTHPDQMAWFAVGRPNDPNSYDYDCSGEIETFYLVACDLTKQSLATGGQPGCGLTWTKKSAAAVCLDNGMALQTCH